jgi:hypothetical protein
LIRRRWPGGDRGAVTAELAAGLPALMVLLVAGLMAVAAATAKTQCVDAAREGALTASRGGAGAEAAAEIAPPGASVDVAVGTETVTVTVRSRIGALGDAVPFIEVTAQATAAREPGTPEAGE